MRFEDQQRTLVRQKQQRDREKLLIIQRHLEIEDKLHRMKETKAHMLEYHRIANEVRLHKNRGIMNNSAIH